MPLLPLTPAERSALLQALQMHQAQCIELAQALAAGKRAPNVIRLLHDSVSVTADIAAKLARL